MIVIEGNATKDPELRFTNDGKAVAKFSVAVNTRQKDKSGEWQDGPTIYYDVSVWRKLGEAVAEHVRKGTRVVVAGKLQARGYVTQSGEQRISHDVTADHVGIVPRWAEQAKKSESWTTAPF